MLDERVRRILFWVTVAVIATVIVTAMVIILRRIIRPGEEAQALNVQPPDVTLCLGAQVVFSVDPPLADVEWAATGGEIGADGAYSAGEVPGDYEVQAAGPDGERGRALVHVVACTPTATPAPTPTNTPAPTPTTPPTPIPGADAQGDVAVYSSGAPAAQSPAELDVRNASVGPDRRVSLGAGNLPSEMRW